MDEHERDNLVKSVAAGDQDAWQRLIVFYHASLRRAIEARIGPGLRPHLDPDDLLQQAYVNAFKAVTSQSRQHERAKSPPLQFDTAAGFYKWLEAIAVARLKDQERAVRRQKRDVARVVHDQPDIAASYPGLIDRIAGSASTPSRQIARDEAIAAVMSCLARLSDDQREVVRLRFLEGKPVAEVAERLGKTESAIHMLCHRGLKSLRGLMVSITRYLSRL